ncbi:MAG: sporulation initiation factor Spo0A C-terminal domain-containing protein, partial [Erysipelotrichaceae bacterium]
SDNYANGYKVMELYKEIALINKTTASRVEKALRYAIKESNLDDRIKCNEFILTLNAKVLLEKEKNND